MVLTLVDTISTLPSASSPTVTGEWVKHSPLVLGAQVDVFCTDEGTLTVQYSYDGASVDTDATYTIADNNWQRIVPVQYLYMRMTYTLTSGIDPTYFRARLYHSDELLETADVQNVALDAAVALNVSNIDIPLSNVETAILGVDSNVQVTNTLLGNLSNLDVPLSDVVTLLDATLSVDDVTGNARLTDINANVVASRNILSTINTGITNVNLNLDGIDSNVQLTNTKLDGVNSNLALLGMTTLNVDSNIQVNGTKLDTLDTSVQAVTTKLNGTLQTKNVDYTTSVYANSVTQTGQILVASPITNGRIKSVLCASRTTDPIVFGIYDTGAIAPTASDTPILVIPMDAGTATMCYHFGDAGVTFNNGLGVRCQDNSGNFNINENNAVSSEVNVMSIVYSKD